MGKHLEEVAVSSGSAKTLKGIKIVKIWGFMATWTFTSVMHRERRGRESQQELRIKDLNACVIRWCNLFIIVIHLSTTQHVFSEFLFQCWPGDSVINKFLLPPSLYSGRKEQAMDKTEKWVKYLKNKCSGWREGKKGSEANHRNECIATFQVRVIGFHF